MPSYTAPAARSSSRANTCTVTTPGGTVAYDATPAYSVSRAVTPGIAPSARPGDDFYAPVLLVGNSGSEDHDVTAYTTQAEEVDLAGAVASIWFRVWPPSSGVLRIAADATHTCETDVWDGGDIADLERRLDPATGTPEGSPTGAVTPISDIDVTRNSRIRMRLPAAASVKKAKFTWTFVPTAGDLDMDVPVRTVTDTPAVLRATIMGADAGETVRFQVAGVAPYSDYPADLTGVLSGVAIQIPRGLSVGTHILRATGQTSGKTADVTFTVQNLTVRPSAPTPDDPPVPVTQSGVRRWVLQDPMTGGLGEYLLPLNPDFMSDPFPENYYTPEHTAGFAGGWLFWEGAERAVTWRFSGQALTRTQVDALRDWAKCRRRIHIHDHRNRAFLCRITGADLTPAAKPKYPDRHTYEFRADVFGWVQQ